MAVSPFFFLKNLKTTTRIVHKDLLAFRCTFRA